MVYNDGTISYISDESGSNYHTFYTPNGVFNFNGSINIDATCGGTVIRGDNMKSFFEFLAKHTSVEWNLQQNSNTGNGIITTTHGKRHVSYTYDSQYDEEYHNHEHSNASNTDSASARKYPYTKHYIYREDYDSAYQYNGY